MLDKPEDTDPATAIRARAQAIVKAGGLAEALASGTTPRLIEVSLSEALVLGLLRQGVSNFAIFGHGSTDLAEILRIYGEEGVTRTINCRNEVAMAHAATALKWQYGETAAVITSIGPGALQAFAGSNGTSAATGAKPSSAAGSSKTCEGLVTPARFERATLRLGIGNVPVSLPPAR